MKRLLSFIIVLSFFSLAFAKPTEGVASNDDLLYLGEVSVSFLYDNKEIDSKKLENGKYEITEKDFGQPSMSLLIYDSFYDTLKKSCKITLSNNPSTSNLKIKINPVFYSSNGFPIAASTIAIHDKDNKQLAFIVICSKALYDADNYNDFAQQFTKKVILELKKIVQ